MSNEKNLIPFSQRTKEEAREYGAAGGRASGAARRRKKSLKEAANLFLSLPVANTQAFNELAISGVDPEDIDNQMMVIAGLTIKAAEGDAKAAKVLFDLLGEDARAADDEGVQIVDDL